jgi:hypothetical protein
LQDIEEDQYAYKHQQSAGDNFDGAEVPLNEAEKSNQEIEE